MIFDKYELSIVGTSYIDHRNRYNFETKYNDPCNPLYWYPKPLSESCYYKKEKIYKPPQPQPIPIPIPLPIPLLPAPSFSPSYINLPTYPDFTQDVYSSPILSQPYGFVPPLPGLVTHDGGINILPFSDAYSDLLDKIKRRKLDRNIRKLLHRY